jgi:hypothetical protein
MTATSWGAPEHWPASPFESFRPHTPDMGFREQHSRPVTPSTATSWGAPEYWPPSPIEHTRPHTPDCAQRAHDEDHPTSFNQAKPWAHVWPFLDIHTEQQRALLESKHGSFQQPAIDSMSRESPNVGGSAMAMEFETNNEADLFAFVWPFFRTTRPRPRPQSVVVPTTYPFLQICKSSFSFSPPRTLAPPTYVMATSRVLMTGPRDITNLDVPTDRPVYPYVTEVYASKSVGELEVPKCQSVRLHSMRPYDCEYNSSSRSRKEGSNSPLRSYAEG